MGWVEEERERNLENRVRFFQVGTRSEIRVDDCDKRRDQLGVERNNLVNPAKAFHLLGSKSDFLLALPESGFKRRAIMGILLASGKGDLSGMGVQMGGPLGEEQVQFTSDLAQRNQDRCPFLNLGVEGKV